MAGERRSVDTRRRSTVVSIDDDDLEHYSHVKRKTDKVRTYAHTEECRVVVWLQLYGRACLALKLVGLLACYVAVLVVLVLGYRCCGGLPSAQTCRV